MGITGKDLYEAICKLATGESMDWKSLTDGTRRDYEERARNANRMGMSAESAAKVVAG